MPAGTRGLPGKGPTLSCTHGTWDSDSRPLPQLVETQSLGPTCPSPGPQLRSTTGHSLSWPTAWRSLTICSCGDRSVSCWQDREGGEGSRPLQTSPQSLIKPAELSTQTGKGLWVCCLALPCGGKVALPGSCQASLGLFPTHVRSVLEIRGSSILWSPRTLNQCHSCRNAHTVRVSYRL